MNSKNVFKRLYYDCETSPNIVTSWNVGYKLKIDYTNIIRERAIICICYKWEHEKTVRSLVWDSRQNDKKMLTEFVKVMNQSDELVAHNGDRFDIKWIRTRCIFHGIPMPPEHTSVDTLKNARNSFRFNSNRLDYIAKFLGVGEKIKTEYDLWKKILLDKNQSALDAMVKYCKQDVLILEGVFQKLKGYVKHKTNAAVLNDGELWDCPRCQSEKTHVNKTKTTAAGTIKRQMICSGCGAYFTISNKVYMLKLQHDSRS